MPNSRWIKASLAALIAVGLAADEAMARKSRDCAAIASFAYDGAQQWLTLYQFSGRGRAHRANEARARARKAAIRCYSDHLARAAAGEPGLPPSCELGRDVVDYPLNRNPVRDAWVVACQSRPDLARVNVTFRLEVFGDKGCGSRRQRTSQTSVSFSAPAVCR